MNVKVSSLRGPERGCSLCHRRVSKSVLVENAGPMHLVFCRQCARRIGVVGAMLEPPCMPRIAKAKATLVSKRRTEKEPQ